MALTCSRDDVPIAVGSGVRQLPPCPYKLSARPRMLVLVRVGSQRRCRTQRSTTPTQTWTTCGSPANCRALRWRL
eukprot:14337800-Alexandrium_andersonii.AAC.1